MAAARKKRKVGARLGDSQTYADFLVGVLAGSIKATALDDVGVQVSTRSFVVKADALGETNVTLVQPIYRLASFDYTDPNG